MIDSTDLKEIPYAATATVGLFSDPNPQLSSWIEAKKQYASLLGRADQNLWNEVRQVVILLGDSLSALFGNNYSGKGGWTPSLMQFVASVFPSEKGWDLKNDNPDLYARLEWLVRIYNDYCKHFDRTKHSAMQAVLTVQNLAVWMETTRRVWNWLLEKRAADRGGTVPQDQLAEFASPFTR